MRRNVILLFFFVFPLTTTISSVILLFCTGVTTVTVSVLTGATVPVAGSTVIVTSPRREVGLSISATIIFCFPAERNVIPLLNFFCQASSVVKAIAFHGLGTTSPKDSEIKIIDPVYLVTVFLLRSTARTVTSIASFALALMGAIISNPTIVESSAAIDSAIGMSVKLTKKASIIDDIIFLMMKKVRNDCPQYTIFYIGHRYLTHSMNTED